MRYGSRLRGGGATSVLLAGLRVCGGCLLFAMGAIHLYLWLGGYASVPVIGVLFLLNVIGAVILGVAVLATPARFLDLAAALATMFMLGTLVALVLSLTVGLFGFVESMEAPLVTSTIVVESAGVVVLAALAALVFRSPK